MKEKTALLADLELVPDGEEPGGETEAAAPRGTEMPDLLVG